MNCSRLTYAEVAPHEDQHPSTGFLNNVLSPSTPGSVVG